MRSSALGHTAPDGRPFRRLCLIASACALLSAASAPAALATPITFGGSDLWASFGMPTFSSPWYLPFGCDEASNGDGCAVVIPGCAWVNDHLETWWSNTQDAISNLLAQLPTPTFHPFVCPTLDGYPALSGLLAKVQQVHEAQVAAIANLTAVWQQHVTETLEAVKPAVEAASDLLPPSCPPIETCYEDLLDSVYEDLLDSVPVLPEWPLPSMAGLSVVPEPGVLSLVAMAALLGGVGVRRRRRANTAW